MPTNWKRFKNHFYLVLILILYMIGSNEDYKDKVKYEHAKYEIYQE